MSIFPAEIENALSEHPGAEVALVIGLPDRDLGSAVHAIVKRSVDCEDHVSADTLSAFVATKLARYQLPASYGFTEQPLRDEAGKVRRSQLRAERIALQAHADR